MKGLTLLRLGELGFALARTSTSLNFHNTVINRGGSEEEGAKLRFLLTLPKLIRYSTPGTPTEEDGWWEEAELRSFLPPTFFCSTWHRNE